MSGTRSTGRGAPWGRRILGVVILAAVAAAVLTLPSLLIAPAEKAPADIPGVLVKRSGDLLYTYHLVSGTEGLFDVTKDPDCLRNLVKERPRDTARLRRLLAIEMGVTDLEDLKSDYDSIARTLRGLGYL